jgi:tetratricopeptide (TPR) repeat protein
LSNTLQEIQSLFREALSIHQRGSVSCARRMYEQILAREPSHFDSCHLLGVTYIQTGSPQLAVDLISRALEINPENADAHYNLAHALRSLKCTDKALSSFDRAISLRPDSVEYHLEKGILLQRLNRFAEAQESFERAADLHPSCIDAHRRRAVVLAGLNRPKEALASIERAISLDVTSPYAHRHKAIILRLLDHPLGALASYGTAIQLDPDHAETHIQFATTLFDLGRYDEALASCDRAITLKSNSAKAFTQRGSVLDRLNRMEEALESFHRALRLDHDYVDAHLGLAWLYARREQWDLACREYEATLSLKQTNMAALRGLATLPEGYLSFDRASELLQFCSSLQEVAGVASQLFVRAYLLKHMRLIRESFESLTRGNELRFSDLHQSSQWRRGFDRILVNASTWVPRPIDNEPGSARKLLVVLGPSRSGKTTLERLICSDKTFMAGFEAGGVKHADSALRALSEMWNVRSVRSSDECFVEVIKVLFLSGSEKILSAEHQVITITNPFLLQSAHLIFDLCPQSRFVFLDRNSLDTAAEVFAKDYIDKYPFAYSPGDALDYVELYQEASAVLCRKMGSRAMKVSYEDLLVSPGSVLTSMYEMLGLEPTRQSSASG